MPKTLEFFYDFASPYSYLASTQVERVAERAGADLRWRPFFLAGVFKETGNTPPIAVAAKAAYLVKDVNDWTRHYALPEFKMPAEFPIRSIRANRLALVAEDRGRIVPFTHLLFRAAFAEGLDIADPELLAKLLEAIGMDPEDSFARAESPEVKDRLRRNTDEALRRGAFGAPTFFVTGGDAPEDMYVGNDRLNFVEKSLGRH